MALRHPHRRRPNDAFDTILDHAERVVRLVVSTVVVAILLWLGWTDPVLSSTSQTYLKALMALAFAVLMASLAGLLEFEGTAPGWTIRAAGGCGIFALVWFTLPAIVGSLERRAAAEITIGKLELFDIRSMEPPGDARLQASAAVAVTVPVDVVATSRFSQAHPAAVRGAVLRLTAGDHTVTLPWLYFVRQVPGQGGSWLSADPLTIAQTFEIAAGTHQYREVLFASHPNQLNWGQVVRHLERAGTLELKVLWKTQQEQGPAGIEQSCRASITGPPGAIRRALRNSRHPGRFVFNCVT
ncbi:hypothetical protein [Pseudoduganella armeniaca]|uniref:Uncharacterized protein n=1 Tax=Pseudoduganella armeniaca TaxID=2072590 RepID=A0A2R4C5N8_9BURK|nr:hypothetical protein [Pseudoduganella armeniaca]AVR94929.1 hypothetical protein C9I28_03765 [Pseudoduganella armeniaca]